MLLHCVARNMFTLTLCALLAVIPAARGHLSPTLTTDGDGDEVALYQSLLDLTNPWTVMCIAAHPDDEDGATLTVLRRKYGAHTVTLFSTYGEGGQNAIGPELYEELGVIRVRETKAAAAIQGSEPRFLGLQDFGFSKSADETFRVWRYERALGLMVSAIRELRPDVIITNHDAVTGHGHHQATGRLILEAFDAAADPARFPGQISGGGLSVWQPQRLFVRVRGEGGMVSRAIEAESSRAGAVISINPSERDPVRGSTYAEQALRALQRHATQGPWPQTVPANGAPVIHYRLAREAQGAAPLPANARMFLDGLRLPDFVSTWLWRLTATGRSPLDFVITDQPSLNFPQRREMAFNLLFNKRRAGLGVPSGWTNEAPRFRLMAKRLDHALAVASGITATLAPRDSNRLIEGEAETLSLSITNKSDAPVRVQSATFRVPERTEWSVEACFSLPPKTSKLVPIDGLDLGHVLPIVSQRALALSDLNLSGERFSAHVNLIINGAGLSIPIVTRVKVVPALEILSIKQSRPLTPTTINRPLTFNLRLANHLRRPFEGHITSSQVVTPCLQNVCPDIPLANKEFTLAAGETRELTMTVSLRSGAERERWRVTLQADPLKYLLTFSVGLMKSNTVQIISQKYVPVRAVRSDVSVAPKLHVGYVRSFDDTLREALDALGVESRALTIDDVRTGDLRQYDTIIIDNRGYQAHPELIAANARLLEYVRSGGTLIVFYQRANEWNPDPQKGRPQLAPYPITLGNERITDENAPVMFSDPQHALLNFPNKIGPDDFKNWIQERGLYYPKEWDARYSALLATNDPNEAPLRGGLLTARYGRGRYIYTSMVWYRQLRAGVPGAFRMFANMISYGHAEKSAVMNGGRRTKPSK